LPTTGFARFTEHRGWRETTAQCGKASFKLAQTIMQTLSYTVIKTASQYQQEELATATDAATRQDELDLLTLLIETWDRTHATLPEADPSSYCAP
jgi:hypothetical protein